MGGFTNCNATSIIAINELYNGLANYKNNNIIFNTPQGGVIYQFHNESYAPVDSTYMNYNNAYDLKSLGSVMEVLYSSQSVIQEIGDQGGLNYWGNYFDADLRKQGYQAYGHPDKNSIDADPMPESASNPVTLNPKLAHTGTPIKGITTDYFGNLRDTVSPSIGAIEIHALTHNIAALAIVNSQICGDTAYPVTAVFQNRTLKTEKNIV